MMEAVSRDRARAGVCGGRPARRSTQSSWWLERINRRAGDHYCCQALQVGDQRGEGCPGRNVNAARAARGLKPYRTIRLSESGSLCCCFLSCCSSHQRACAWWTGDFQFCLPVQFACGRVALILPGAGAWHLWQLYLLRCCLGDGKDGKRYMHAFYR